MITTATELSPLAFEIARLAAGDHQIAPHAALRNALPPAGENDVQAAFGELAHAGLWSLGALHHDLVDTFQVLDAPAREIYGWYGDTTPPHGVVAAEDVHGHGVVVVRTPSRVRLEPVPGEKLCDALARLLPPHPPGDTGPITVPHHDLDRALHGPRPDDPDDEDGLVLRTTAAPRRVPAATDPAQAASTVLKLPRTSGGQLHGRRRDHLGRRTEGELLTWIDTSRGRWLQTRRNGRIILTPATHDALVAHLRALLAEHPYDPRTVWARS